MKLCIAAVFFLSVLVMPAWAQGGLPHDPSDAIHTVAVGLTNSDGLSGTFDTSTIGTWDEGLGEDGQLHFYYDFASEAGYDVLALDNLTVIGTIYSLNYEAKPEPQVILNFSCKAGRANTTFSYKSAVSVIPPLTNASARASASMTLTDNSVPTNGVFANGNYSGKVYQARYNTTSVFTNLVSSFSGPSGSPISTENDPLDGISYRAIPGTITEMEAEYNFVLQAYDSASGTSNYVILGTPVPEPSSMLALATAMIGLIGFGVKRRR